MSPARRASRAPAWGPVAVALGACALCYLAGWRGTDWAAQVYRSNQSAHYGLLIWDPGWYGGTFPLNYSLLYPPLAGALGLWPVAFASVGGATVCFDRLMTPHLGRRPLGVWYFAVATIVEVAIGQLPSLAGEALALAAILAVRYYLHGGRGRVPVLALGLMAVVLSALMSPVAGSFLALAFVSWGLASAQRGRRLGLVGVGALTLATSASLTLAFPGPGYFPFLGGDLAVLVCLCALLAGPVLAAPPAVRACAVLYGLVSICLFAVKTQMGDNDARFGAYIGVPVAICYLLARPVRLHRPGPSPGGAYRQGPGARGRPGLLVIAATAALAVWAWGPVAEATSPSGTGPSSTAAFYQPLVDRLAVLAAGAPVRVEIPPTLDHWESAYVAPVFPLARGWERQLDMAYDPIFYQPGALNDKSYLSWLGANGVSFVALARAPLDYAAVAEADLLRRGQVPGLRLVWRSPNWDLWRVLGSPGLSTGAGRLVTLGPHAVKLRFDHPGPAVVKLRWSAHWSLAWGEGATACVARAPGGWTEVRSSRKGLLTMSMAALGAEHGRCPNARSQRANSLRSSPYDR